jgi:glyoxylase-like metal-dependent hydrolase (beta-lactamase superfamily II)
MIHIEKSGPVTRYRLARTVLGRGRYFTAAYLVDGLLVDSGCAHTVDELTRALETEQVHTVVNTHSHEDHVAGNAAIQRLHGAQLLAHELAAPILANPRRQQQQLYRRLFWGYPEPSSVEPLEEAVATPRYRFDVILTPGHSLDHVALHEPREGWLFVGDAFVGGRDRALRRDADPWQTIASLRRLAALDVRGMYPGSGTIYARPHEALLTKIDYLEQLGGRVVELHRRGWPLRRIQRHVLGREHVIARLSGGDFSGFNLIRQLVACHPQAETSTIPAAHSSSSRGSARSSVHR